MGRFSITFCKEGISIYENRYIHINDPIYIKKQSIAFESIKNNVHVFILKRHASMLTEGMAL